MEFPFEKLHVWKKARTFVKQVYLFSERFPGKERFGLTDQIRRAAVSVASNLAEGSTRFSEKDRARFITMAYGSLMEVMNQGVLAYDLQYLPEKEYLQLRLSVEELSRMLTALYKAYLKGGEEMRR